MQDTSIKNTYPIFYMFHNETILICHTPELYSNANVDIAHKMNPMHYIFLLYMIFTLSFHL